MQLEFVGEVWFWKGPAPHHFVTVPTPEATMLGDVAAAVTYGWGMIPVTVQLGGTTWTTSLFPKSGGYVVPLKAAARAAEGIQVGDQVTLRLTVEV